MKKTYLIEIKDETFEEERSLYNLKNAVVSNCRFSGAVDGESPLKESKDIKVEKSFFDLRYSFWHVNFGFVSECNFSSLARAPFWYCNNLVIDKVTSEAVKVFRECKNVEIIDSSFKSEEPFWKNNHITVKSSSVEGFYGFFNCKHALINNLSFKGKYSFQYNKNLIILNSNLDTKDAFWHCKNVVVVNSIIKGEYIGWYSNNMIFINCTIESHQPFCYSKNLKFINCKMPNCDLAFENSTVKGNLIGEIDSIKNPIKCVLKVDNVKEVIKDSPLHKVKIKLLK